MKKAVIDGDYYLYAAGFATDGEPVSHSCQALKVMIQNILDELGVKDHEIFVSGKGNFREDVAFSVGYKATRSTRKPSNYDEMKRYLIEQLHAKTVDGMEADDKVSMLLWEDHEACGGDKHRAEIVLVTVDKDLNNTPGWHYNSKKKSLYWVTPRQAARHFWYQMLAGDKVDNIPGLPATCPYINTKYGTRTYTGFGEASAKKVMAASTTAQEAMEDVITCYIAWGDSVGMDQESIHDYLMEQGQLLWMIRELDMFGVPDMFRIEDGLYDRLYGRYIREQAGEADTEGAGLLEGEGGAGGGRADAGGDDGSASPA